MSLTDTDAHSQREQQRRVEALRRGLTDLDNRRCRLLRALELNDDPDGELARDVNTLLAEIKTERATNQAELDKLTTTASQRPNPKLLTALPTGTLDLRRLPEHLLRRLFDALRLKINYHNPSN